MRAHRVCLVLSLVLLGLTPRLAAAGWANITPPTMNEVPFGIGFGYNGAGDKRVFVGSFGQGVFYTDDRGTTWSNVYDDFVLDPPAASTIVRDVLFNPANPAQGIAITWSGSYATVSNGASWYRHPANEAGDSPAIGVAMALIPDGSGLLATEQNQGLVGGAIWRYTWATDEWAVLDPAMLLGTDGYFAIAFDRSTPPAYYTTSSSKKIIWSDDMGVTPHTYGQTLPAGTVTAIVCDPDLPARVHCSMGNKLYRATDRTSGWTLAWTFPSDVTALICNPGVTNRMYAGTASNGVYHSTNRGNTWSQLSTSGLTYQAIIDLGMHPETASRLYASAGSAAGFGVFSTDVPLPHGHDPDPEQGALRETREESGSGGMALRSAGEMLWLRLGSAAEVELEVFDPNGRRLRTMALGSMTAGEHQVTWDAMDDGGRRVAPGVYLYRARTGRGGTASAKAVVLR